MVLGSPIGRACSPFAYRTIAFFGPPFQVIRLGYRFVTLRPSLHPGRIRSHDTGRTMHAGFNVRLGLGCFPFARRYSGNRFCFLFLELLRCFSSLRWLPPDYVFIRRMTRVCLAGFPHSEIYGSTLICSYPKLIAACHVLHRLSTPRHPPSTLTSLTRKPVLVKMPLRITLILLSKNVLESPDYHWWRRPGSNRRPSPCKGDALPAELLPLFKILPDLFLVLVGLARVELATSRLSGVRSNQLSYRPLYMKQRARTAARERGSTWSLDRFVRLRTDHCSLRKEVIQPHLPIRLPCYDLAPVTGFTFGGSIREVRSPTSGTPSFHRLTGGVYKARERIHRGLLIRGY
jgi:hypothetical protein